MLDQSNTFHGVTCQSIPRITFQTSQELGIHLAAARTPFIAIGLLDSWKALREWTPDYFAQRYGDLEVAASIDLPSTGSPYTLRPGNHVRKMKLGEFIEFMGNASKACYVHQMSVAKLPDLISDTEFEVILPPETENGTFYLWLGSRGTRSGLHFDRYDNINAQIFGKKSVFLVSPDQSGKLYPFKDNVEKSQLDPDAPQFDQFPRFRFVNAHTATIEPSEVLFIPKLWWHHIRSLEPSININCWYGEHIPLSAIFRVINAGGLSCWSQIMRDFILCGLLGRKVEARLFSDTPTGKFLYGIMVAALKKRALFGARRSRE